MVSIMYHNSSSLPCGLSIETFIQFYSVKERRVSIGRCAIQYQFCVYLIITVDNRLTLALIICNMDNEIVGLI